MAKVLTRARPAKATDLSRGARWPRARSGRPGAWKATAEREGGTRKEGTERGGTEMEGTERDRKRAGRGMEGVWEAGAGGGLGGVEEEDGVVDRFWNALRGATVQGLREGKELGLRVWP